jgi:hypothetical protein
VVVVVMMMMKMMIVYLRARLLAQTPITTTSINTANTQVLIQQSNTIQSNSITYVLMYV